MSKYELTIASDYVPNWTLVDAVRELFQNALDQEAQEPSNTASWEYVDDVFRISNKTSVLTAKTLLLGTTTKKDDKKTIGQFGEGYKLAALVLLRLGKTMTIYNYGAREVWRPRFVKSRRFGADILTFFVDKKYAWSDVPDNNLTIEVEGITPDEWVNEVVPSNLHLQVCVKTDGHNEYGEALTEERHAGLVFVNGLYVCKYDQYHYGYNFKPGLLKLDRDRKLVSDFDLKWLASKFWLYQPQVLDLIEKGYMDVAYVSSLYGTGELSEAAYERFRSVHGPRAVPVTSQYEAESLSDMYIAIIVSESYRDLIKRSKMYEEPTGTMSPTKRLEKWFNKIWTKVTEEEYDEFYEILRELKNE